MTDSYSRFQMRQIRPKKVILQKLSAHKPKGRIKCECGECYICRRRARRLLPPKKDATMYLHGFKLEGAWGCLIANQICHAPHSISAAYAIDRGYKIPKRAT